jgi:thiol-disulfide isomerase/thioredoxin
MKQFLTLLLLGGTLLSCTIGKKQDEMNVIRIEFEGRQYDSLYLVLWLMDDNRRESIKGHSKNGYRWKFSYPDSLHDRIYISILQVPGVPDTVRHDIGFCLVLQDDTLRATNFIFRRSTSLVKARYIETKIHFDVPMIRRGTDDLIQGTLISDYFEISTDDQELISSIKAIHGGYGFLWHEILTYEEIVQHQMEFIKQYPNSQFMICCLHMNKGGYKSKDDVAKVFNLFSEELQQSFFGRKIYRHITRADTVFKNQILPTWNTGVSEAIVQDSTKYNLIIFSASWCQPCIKAIPSLKEIYQDFEQNLIMTYVSVDEEKTAENWRKKMREQEIPWRSLMVLNKEKSRAIREDYEFSGIPFFILVHPNSMKLEKLGYDVEDVKQRLYELIKI